MDTTYTVECSCGFRREQLNAQQAQIVEDLHQVTLAAMRAPYRHQSAVLQEAK
jgi:hypothetical protein